MKQFNLIGKLILKTLINIHDLLKANLVQNSAPNSCAHCAQTSVKVLDNADIKVMLKIGDTKLYHLKKKKILKVYDLDGKDIYLENEVIEAIRNTLRDR